VSASTSTTSTGRVHVRRRCPQCGHSVKRILRSANDKRSVDADRWRRFRCRSCDWQGLLAVSTSQRSRENARALARTGRALLVLLVGGALMAAGLTVLQMLMEG
jgi:uncharacterized protein with PIN domain